MIRDVQATNADTGCWSGGPDRNSSLDSGNIQHKGIEKNISAAVCMNFGLSSLEKEGLQTMLAQPNQAPADPFLFAESAEDGGRFRPAVLTLSCQRIYTRLS